MSLPTGLAGTSLALGIFNATQIASIKSQIESLTTLTPPVDLLTNQPEIITDAPVIEKTIQVDEVEPLQETVFSSSESSDVAELQTKLSDLERFSNQVNTRSVQNSNNVTIKGDELNRLSTFTTEALISVRERLSTSENSITQTSSNVEINASGVQDLVESVRLANERIDLDSLNISDLGSGLVGVQQRMDASESNAVELAAQISDVVLAADATGDNISLLDDLLVDTKESLESVIDSWNNFNSVAFVGDSKLQTSRLDAEFCNIAFKHNNADQSALHWTSDLNGTSWASFLAKPDGLSTDGTSPKQFGAITSWALRTRLSNNSEQGFLLETGSGDGIFGVSVGGILDLGSNCRMTDLSENAAFGNRSTLGTTGFGIIQDTSGKTQVNSQTGKDLNLCVGGVPKCIIEGDSSSVTIINNDETSDTHFNYRNSGNWIRAPAGKGTNFSFGKNAVSVSITDKEVKIDGKNVKASLDSLAARVKALESKDYVLGGTKLRLINGNNSNMIRKATSGTGAIMDSRTRDSRSLWEIELA